MRSLSKFKQPNIKFGLSLICTFDLFNKGRHKYTFQSICLEDNEIVLNDEAEKIVLNTKGIMNDLSEELIEFLAYVEDSTDDTVHGAKWNLVKTIHKRVQEVKNDISVEVEFMTLLERDREKIEEGKIEVLKETIMDNLRELGNIPKNLIYSINEQNNIDILKSWNKISVIAKSFDEFQEKIK